MANTNEFYTTRNLFLAYTNYTDPLSYDDWLLVADDCKVAVLYCQFFEQITLAWYKVKSVYSLEADGVSEVLMYLNKNVEKIKEDKSRFTPAYIYKVAYNCLYCLCRDMNPKKRIYQNEISNISRTGEDEELDLFNMCVDNYDETAYDMDEQRDRFWSIIESKGEDAVIVVATLLGDRINWTDKDPDILERDEDEDMVWKHHKVTYDKDGLEELKAATDCIIHTIQRLENGKYKVEYDAWEARHYKGYRKFSKKDFEKISDDRKVEILEDLRSVLEEFVDIFMD